MNTEKLFYIIREKKSFLCIGLDTDLQRIPAFLTNNKFPEFEFNKQIIDKTADFTIAYKPNLAFYETRGAEGWNNLQMTVKYIREKYPDIFIIADAKRADIGNTSKAYAQAFLKEMDFDAITVNPYMGEDSVLPFLSYNNKWVILLALTSNPGAADFQFSIDNSTNLRLFELVIKKSLSWGNKENIMYVIGATKADMLSGIRKIIPDHFLLIPGIGAQGGNLGEVAKYGLNSQCGLIVNSSRNIIYADNTEKFSTIAGERAFEIQKEMEALLEQYKII